MGAKHKAVVQNSSGDAFGSLARMLVLAAYSLISALGTTRWQMERANQWRFACPRFVTGKCPTLLFLLGNKTMLTDDGLKPSFVTSLNQIRENSPLRADSRRHQSVPCSRCVRPRVRPPHKTRGRQQPPSARPQTRAERSKQEVFIGLLGPVSRIICATELTGTHARRRPQ